MGYDAIRTDGSDVDSTIISNARFVLRVTIATLYFLLREERGGHIQKTYGETYGAMAQTAIGQLVGIVPEFVNHCFCDGVLVEEQWLKSSERRDANLEVLRFSANLCSQRPVKVKFTSVAERKFQTFEAGAAWSLNDCYLYGVLDDDVTD